MADQLVHPVDESLLEADRTPPARVTIGARFEIVIDDIGFGGEGVGRVDGFAVFVYFTIPGERVEIEITEVRKSFARAKLIAVRTPSPDRVAAPCPHFGQCGGCQYQHIRYSRTCRLLMASCRE